MKSLYLTPGIEQWVDQVKTIVWYEISTLETSVDRSYHYNMEGGRAKLEAWSHTLGPGKGSKKGSGKWSSQEKRYSDCITQIVKISHIKPTLSSCDRCQAFHSKHSLQTHLEKQISLWVKVNKLNFDLVSRCLLWSNFSFESDPISLNRIAGRLPLVTDRQS